MQFTKNSLFFPGQNLITLVSVDSTNRYAKLLLSNSRPVADGTVILAEHQSAGRGQMSSSWLSETGKNLTFSIIVHPFHLSPDQQFKLNKVVALSVFDLFAEMNLEVKIKWPNDIICPEGKLGGILIENIIQGNTLKHAIIGIGINLNQTEFPDAAGSAVSVRQLTGINYDLIEVLNLLLFHFGKRYLQLKRAEYGLIDTDYLKNLLGYNEICTYEIDGMQVAGIIRGILETGELELDFQGKIRLFWLKEIKFVHTGPPATN